MRLYVVFDHAPGAEGDHPRFVEVEDEHGRAHGMDVGIEWSPHPGRVSGDMGYVRLGPFRVLGTEPRPGALDRQGFINAGLALLADHDDPVGAAQAFADGMMQAFGAQ